MTEQTEALRNGARLPTHPADTTARKVVAYHDVMDAHSGVLCEAGLHGSEIAMLQRGEKMGLSHLHRYAIRDGKIFHTRSRVIISVETAPIDDGDIQ